MEKIMKLIFNLRGYHLKNHESHFTQEGSAFNFKHVPIVMIKEFYSPSLCDMRDLLFTTDLDNDESTLFALYNLKKL